MKFRFPTLLILLACSASAWAIYPLVLTHEFQLPSAAPFDVQHVTSDTTFGWAQVYGDTIKWVRNLGDSISTYIIPDRAFHDYFELYPRTHNPVHTGIALLNTPLEGDDLCVMIQSEHMWDSEWGHFIYCLLNIENDSVLGSYWQEWYFSYSVGSYYYVRQLSTKRLIPWPSLPLPTSFIVYGSSWNWEEYVPGGFWAEGTNDITQVIDLRSGNFDAWQIDSSGQVSLFADGGSTARFALGGRSYERRWSEEYGEESLSDRRWMTTYTADSAANNPFFFPTANVIAQVDSDGTQRIIGEGLYAYDPDNYVQLWHNHEPSGSLWTFRTAESPDERVLAYQPNTHRFRVYHAANGVFLGETTPIQGGIISVLKPPNRLHEFVTWEWETHTIRIYESRPWRPDLEQLTVSYLAAEQMLQLNWPLVEGASGYVIYSSSYFYGPWQEVVTLFGNQITYHLPAVDSQKFFRVTAMYEE